MMTTVLTEELLARAEQVYLMALAKEAGISGRYHKEAGTPEGWMGLPAKETKWLT